MADTARNRRTGKPRALTGRVRAADPFELIRWLARSQPDPRKALAELVQNALDAGAGNVRITRLRKAGVSQLHITDDGAGVIPELERTDALKYIATNIGHSRKRGLTPDQRRELMLQGKYGIGLLGFWSMGRTLEIRTIVPGQTPYVLRMHEESPRYEIERVRGRLALDQRRTEVIVSELHRPALMSLSGRRMAEYLAGELRGQLLAHRASVIVHDRIARGRAQKVLEVVPRRFEGERLEVPEIVAVPGYSEATVELYLLPSGTTERGSVSLSAGGTVVHDDITRFEVADFGRHPWSEPRLHGVIEFADFQVPPGTRRGVLPNQAALAFAAAIHSLEAAVAERLEAAGQRASAEVEATLLKELTRAFREVPRMAPEYDFFAVRQKRSAVTAQDAGTTTAGMDTDGGGTKSPGPGVAPMTDGAELAAPPLGEEPEPVTELALAGPLASAVIVPDTTRVERLGNRRFRLEAHDADGLAIRSGVAVAWRCASPLARIERETGLQTSIVAGPATGTVEIHARVTCEDRSAEAVATVEIVDSITGAAPPGVGIPDPAFVDEPAGDWRSRMSEGRWEVNSGHADFRMAAETPRRKLRYLAALLAKEVVLHSFPGPQLGPALERLVEVLTITERGLQRRK